MDQGRAKEPSSSSPFSRALSRVLREAVHWGNETIKMSFESLPTPASKGDLGLDIVEDELAFSSGQGNATLAAASLLNQTDFLLGGGDNESIPDPYFPHYIRTTSTLLCGIILVIGIVGNVLVPIVVWKNKELRSSTNVSIWIRFQ